VASFQDRAKQFGYEFTGASDVMAGSRKLGKATTFTEGLKGVGQLGYGLVGLVPGAGFLTKVPKLAKLAKLTKESPINKSVLETVPKFFGAKKGFTTEVTRKIPYAAKPRQFVRTSTYSLTTPRGIAASSIATDAVQNQVSMGLNYQDPNKNLGTIQDKVTKQINAIQPTYNPSGRKGGPYSTENLFKGSFSTSGFPGLNVNQKPNLTIVKPNDGTLKPRPKQPPAAVVPKPVAPKAPVPPARRKPEDIYSFPPKTPPRVVQPPVTTRPAQPSTQPSTQTVTTPPDTTRPRVYPDNYSGTTTWMDLNKDRIAAEAAKATEDIKRQNDYNTYLDEVKRNATLAEQQRFTQEQNDIVQRGALQQQRTQLENKEYGIPPYLEAASKRYQGGLARSQALGAIREQDIRDALSQRQMSARGRSAGTVGGLAPALLGSGLTGAGRSYKLDTRNEVLRRAEEQAALKESYDVYLAEAAREAQLEQLEDAKTRSLLIDQIRSLGSN
jgi:hypothetical protein